MKGKKVTEVFTDASYDGTFAGVAVVYVEANGEVRRAEGKICKAKSIQEAELRAVKYAVDAMTQKTSAVIYNDNKTVIDLLSGIGKAPTSNKDLADAIRRNAALKDIKLAYRWIPREGNGRADAVAVTALRKMSCVDAIRSLTLRKRAEVF